MIEIIPIAVAQYVTIFFFVVMVLPVQIPAERRSHSEMNGMYIPT